MKKWISLSLALIMLLACTPALALKSAASVPDWSHLQRYASFREEGTRWTVRANETEAALARMSAEIAPYNGCACFGLELTGDLETGLIVPVLAFYYTGNTILNGRSASLALDGVRYDVLLTREEIMLGRNRAERLSTPLDEDGLAMIHALMTTEEPVIRLYGDTAFTMEPKEKETYASTREELSARSLSGLSALLNEFTALGEYGLWDLNAIWWERIYGSSPAMQIVSLPTSEDHPEGLLSLLKAPMYQLARGDQGKAVSELQALLVKTGYMQGKADGGYGADTVRAVLAAQTWLGLTPTGNADESLIRLLSGESLPSVGSASAACAPHTVDGLCELSVERCWFADAVESAGGERRVVADRDNTFLIAEGCVCNLARENLDFYWQISAVAQYGEYEYPCVLVCERNEGETLSSTLPPLGQARLLILAEIPDTLVDKTDLDWSIKVKAGTTELCFD